MSQGMHRSDDKYYICVYDRTMLVNLFGSWRMIQGMYISDDRNDLCVYYHMVLLNNVIYWCMSQSYIKIGRQMGI